MIPWCVTLAAGGAVWLAACASIQTTEDGQAPGAASADRADDARPWWRDAVFYEIFVRSWADSTEGPLAGDGIGDFRGIIERLDYLNDGDPTTDSDLGVTGIWLMPIHPSPSYHGYDVTDYRDVNPEYGTMDDFRELVRACHERGIRVIIDLVLNHSSSEHPWFLDSIDPDSDKRDWYLWSDESWIGPWSDQHVVWHDDHMARAGQRYFGLFWHEMPDLNVQNPELTRELQDIGRFWLEDVGIDGFRLDAIKHLVEDGRTVENTPGTIAWLEGYESYLNQVDPDSFTVGEVWSSTEEIARYVGGAVDSAFEFPLAYAIVDAVRDGDATALRETLAGVQRAYASPDYATFLRNHDMTRTMTELGGDPQKAVAAASIQLLLPGVPFIYYGEEIGMIGDKPDPDLRTPMQWTTDVRTAGFTTGTPWKAVPVAPGFYNVDSQQRMPGSILRSYKRLLSLRSSLPALREGSLELVDTNHDGVFAFVRATEEQRVLVIVNLTARPAMRYRLDAAKLGVTQTARGRDRVRNEEIKQPPPARPQRWRPIEPLFPYSAYVLILDE